MVDGGRRDSNKRSVDYINQGSIFNFQMSYALEVHPVNRIHNFSRCKSKLTLLY